MIAASIGVEVRDASVVVALVMCVRIANGHRGDCGIYRLKVRVLVVMKRMTVEENSEAHEDTWETYSRIDRKNHMKVVR